MTQTSLTKVLIPSQTGSCPLCGSSTPRLACVHDEYIAECCDDLPIFIETQDPDGETGLMNACFDRESAMADWKGCVAYARARINSMTKAA